ncbi:hypothetical protein GCM10022235_16700 [Kribbella ginsengisoli]|uniref:SdpI family protein n=1 Tax=Kribbella ginsengisoli TaxID=363865 RepID=A0ABP6WF92_9ACTN
MSAGGSKELSDRWELGAGVAVAAIAVGFFGQVLLVVAVRTRRQKLGVGTMRSRWTLPPTRFPTRKLVLSGRARLNQILSLVLSATVVAILVLEAVELEGVVSVTCSLMVEFAVFIGVTAGGRVGGSACSEPGCSSHRELAH